MAAFTMFVFLTLLWTAICACWALKGLGWPIWQSDATTAWQSLGPMARIDDSALPLVALIVIWVSGLALLVSFKGRGP